MPEHEPPDFEQCAVCGRTALRGETLSDYVTTGGEPRRVCALCKAQAESAGWLPSELAARPAAAAPRHSRARALRDRLSRVAEQARTRPAEAPADDSAPAGNEEAPVPRRRFRLLVERNAPEDTHPWRDAPSARERQRERRSVSEARPVDPHNLARRAAERFNASEARRTVAGLVRSLGEPHASIDVNDGAGDAKVTVAWELSWYQWEIDPGAHGQVRQVRKGDEIEELSDAEREWNARVADDGSLRVTSA